MKTIYFTQGLDWFFFKQKEWFQTSLDGISWLWVALLSVCCVLLISSLVLNVKGALSFRLCGGCFSLRFLLLNLALLNCCLTFDANTILSFVSCSRRYLQTMGSYNVFCYLFFFLARSFFLVCGVFVGDGGGGLELSRQTSIMWAW